MGRVGLLTVWASAVAGMFFIYLVQTFFPPVLAFLNQFAAQVFAEFGVTSDNPFYQLWQYWIPILAQYWGYLTFAAFIGLLIYVVVGAARREPNEVMF